MPISPRKLARTAKVLDPKNLKSVDVDFSNATRGSHDLVESFQRKSSPFHKGANATRRTTVNGEGRSTNTSFTYQPGKLTRTGKVTAAGVGAAAYGGAVVADSRSHNNRKKKMIHKSMDNVSYWGVDHGEEVSKEQPRKLKDRHYMLRPTVYNSRSQNVKAGAAGGAAAGGALGGAVGGLTRGRGGAKGRLARAGIGAAIGGTYTGSISAGLGALEPTKKSGGAKRAQAHYQRMADARADFRTAKKTAKKDRKAAINSSYEKFYG